MQTSTTTHGNATDGEYAAFLTRLQDRFNMNTGMGLVTLFETDTTGLWDAYLSAFRDPIDRQYHNCNACRRFIERFGGLVTILPDGNTVSVLWNAEDAPPSLRAAITKLARRVEGADVEGVFLASDRVWGTPTTGPWEHLSLTPDPSQVFTRATQTAGQAMAEKREDFKNVLRALQDFTVSQLATAVRVLEANALDRSEKTLAAAQWLHDTKVAHVAASGHVAKRRAIWLAVGYAPAVFCHPRAGMIGTLLEDIAAGLSFEVIKRKWNEKMHPLQYQRPQAAPKAGTIAQAEKALEQMGAAGSLRRRFARLDEIKEVLWRPCARLREPENTVRGVFSHLTPKGTASPSKIILPTQTMTWVKFKDTVLEHADRIALLAPYGGPYTTLLTAADADAPPILQWDSVAQRNPLSWYFWLGGSTSGSFGLVANDYVDVLAVAYKPSMWHGDQHPHQGKGVLFALAGARDTRTPGLCLFPEILRSEFHGWRSVVEAYSRSRTVEPQDGPLAAGLMFHDGSREIVQVRVWSRGSYSDYRIDRWD